MNSNMREPVCLALKNNGELCGNRASYFCGNPKKISCGNNYHIQQCYTLSQDEILARQLVLDDEYVERKFSEIEDTVNILRDFQENIRQRIDRRFAGHPPFFQPSLAASFPHNLFSQNLNLFGPIRGMAAPPPSQSPSFFSPPIPPPVFSSFPILHIFDFGVEEEGEEEEVKAILPTPKKFSELPEEERGRNPSCGVCFETYRDDTDVCLTDCRHSFCQECLQKWIDESKTTCPLCRSLLSVESV